MPLVARVPSQNRFNMVDLQDGQHVFCSMKLTTVSPPATKRPTYSEVCAVDGVLYIDRADPGSIERVVAGWGEGPDTS